MSMPVRSARQDSNRAGTEGAPHRLRRPLALTQARAMLRAVGVTALVLSSLFASTVRAADARVERLASSVTIYRDTYGVTKVYQLFVYETQDLRLVDARTASLRADDESSPGSNMWAVGPRKSADGHAMLFINPHVFFFGPTQFYEGHLLSGEGWNISGASFLGMPFPVIGHNEYLGWTHTVNYPGISDLYVEKFDDPQDPLAYAYASGHRRAPEWTEV